MIERVFLLFFLYNKMHFPCRVSRNALLSLDLLNPRDLEKERLILVFKTELQMKKIVDSFYHGNEL
jgi:hypothetical protein